MKFELRWRLLALLAIAGYITIGIATIVLFLRSPILITLATITIASIAYGVWLIFTGTGERLTRGKIFTTLFTVLLVVEVLLIINSLDSLRTVLVLCAIMVLYTLFVNLLRREYWRRARLHGHLTKETAHFKKPYLIINPKSGSGRATKSRLADHAKDLGIATITLKKSDDVEALARQAADQGADVLGVSGGDGSIGAVAKVALERDLPIVVLAGGTRCHFARDLGLDPAQINDGLAGFRGVERKIDVGDINGRIFLNNASFGLYADIVDSPDYRDNKVAVSRAVLQDILSGKKDGYKLSFSHGNKKYDQATQVLVGVNRYNTINLLELGERDKLDQGVLQITAITKLSDELVKQMMKVFSINFSSGIDKIDGVDQWDSKNFKVTSPRKKIVAGVDGEREEYASPVTVSIKPGALRVYVPAEGIRTRPKKALSFKTIAYLWQALWGKDIR